jgi:hypothetical protein
MNFSYLLQVITAYFHYEHSNGLLQLAESFIEYTGLILGILGFIINISKRLAVEDFFFIIICALIIYYPFHDPRYFMPALPLLFYYCYTVLNLIATAIPGINKQVVAIALTVIYLLTGYHYFEEVVNEVPTDYIPKQKDLIAFRYISQHVDDSDLIVFIRPRALTLFTDKRSIVFSMQISPEMNKKVFDGMHAKYMLVIDGMNDNYLKTYLNGVQHPIDSSKISDGYTLYTLR